MAHMILILPGFCNSGDGHWQTLWEAMLPNARRVQQQDWSAPVRQEWVSRLDVAIRDAQGGIVLVAHSLGCALTAWWATQHGDAPHAAKIKGALLVAPPDVECADFPDLVRGFAPMPRAALPFNSMVIASSDDPWCELSKAQSWACAWGAAFHDIGPCGHINAESGIGDWPRGRAWLAELTA